MVWTRRKLWTQMLLYVRKQILASDFLVAIDKC